MVKEYDKSKLEEGVISFEGNLYVFNEKKSIATISIPMPTIKKLNINKETKLGISIQVKNDK